MAYRALFRNSNNMRGLSRKDSVGIASLKLEYRLKIPAKVTVPGAARRLATMKKWLQKHFKGYMIRPTVYRAVTYFLLALVVVLIWNRFINARPMPLSYAFTIVGIFFLASAWLSYLRLDGVNIPLLTLVPIGRKQRPLSGLADMSDYMDTDIVPFEELTKDEQNICCLLANIICGTVYLVLSLV